MTLSSPDPSNLSCVSAVATELNGLQHLEARGVLKWDYINMTVDKMGSVNSVKA